MARTAGSRASGQAAHQKRGRSIGEGCQGAVGRGEGPGVAGGVWGPEEREGIGRGSVQKAVATGDHRLKPRGCQERGGLGESTGTNGAGWGQRGKQLGQQQGRKVGKDKDTRGAGRLIGRCGLPISCWQQIFATTGVCRMSITAAIIFLKKMIRGAMEKGANHQGDNNQPHRLALLIKGKGHGGRGGWQWQLER